MNEQVNKKSSKNILSIIIIILLIVLIVIGVMILLKEDNKNENKTDTNNNDVVEVEDTNTNNADDDFIIIKFDGTKAINPTSKESKYSLNERDTIEIDSFGLSIDIPYDKRSAVINIDFSNDFLSKGYQIDKTDITKSYEIKNFDKDIKEVYLTGFGQGIGCETIFYVMEDGTVEYTPIGHVLKNNDINDTTIFKSYGKIKDVEGVIKLVKASEDNPNLAGGGMSIIGIRQDGSFYDLSKIIYQTGYYNFY